MDDQVYQSPVPVNYPLNKQEAEQLLTMTASPGWAAYIKCMEFEAQVYVNAVLQQSYEPYAMEKIRFNQGLAANLTRIPVAIIESANAVLNNTVSLDSLYDGLYE